jgi:hypothetical protein
MFVIYWVQSDVQKEMGVQKDIVISREVWKRESIPQYLLDMRWGAAQSSSGCCGKKRKIFCSLPGIKPYPFSL